MDLAAIIQQLGLGGIFGFIVGYAAKKVAIMFAVLLAIFFVLIQYLAYKGLVEVNWHHFNDLFSHAVSAKKPTSAAARVFAILAYNLPFGGAFVAGLYLGWKRG